MKKRRNNYRPPKMHLAKEDGRAFCGHFGYYGPLITTKNIAKVTCKSCKRLLVIGGYLPHDLDDYSLRD